MTQFSDEDVRAQLNDLASSRRPPAPNRPDIIAFCCPSSSKAAPSAEASPVSLDIVEMPCTGRVDVLHMMHAFERGADGVLIAACEPGQCGYASGNLNAEKRMRWIRGWLDEIGLDAARARMVHVPNAGAAVFAEAVHGLAAELRALGSSPVRAAPAKSVPGAAHLTRSLAR